MPWGLQQALICDGVPFQRLGAHILCMQRREIEQCPNRCTMTFDVKLLPTALISTLARPHAVAYCFLDIWGNQV
jgi:hypothetical protein